MEESRLEKIENYLLDKMSSEEESEFEKALNESSDLRNDTKQVAYIIASIQIAGLEEENKRLAILKQTMKGDGRRYWLSVAAMFAVLLSFAAITSVPAYKYVVKPIIEKIISPSPKKPVKPEEPIETIPADTIEFVDTVAVEEDVAEQAPVPAPVKEKEVVQPVAQQPTTVAIDTVQKVATPVKLDLPPNRIVTYNKLQNYEFSEVDVRREGNNVICSFTMTNEVENASIQMHSARAQDDKGKNYPAKQCLLNGTNKRIKENWEKGIAHTVEITIEDVSADVTGFKQISFSFQSAGDTMEQKSQSIVLEVGEII